MEGQESAMQRDEPQVSAERKALVTRWQDEIRADKDFFKDDFKQMRADMALVRTGADKDWVNEDKYVTPLVGRHINRAVASLYAKNPKATARRRPRIMAKLWDGSPESLQMAMQGAQMGDPNALAIIEEAQSIQSYNRMIDKLGKTLEILFWYYMQENGPTFKQQMKQAVRRTKTCAVGYVEIGFQRVFEPNPDATRRIDDMTRKIQIVEQRLADAADGEIKEGDAELEQLRLDLAQAQQEGEVLAREGLIFDYPRATEIIPHRNVKLLHGFIGADYVTREFHLSVDEIKEIYKVDIGSSYKKYKTGDTGGLVEADDKHEAKKNKACVWRVQDKKNRQVFTLVEGYPDFLQEPTAPSVKVDGFWTIFALSFNLVEDENKAIPPSDASFLRHPQREYNNVRQGLREHRHANRPKYFTKKGILEDSDKAKLQSHPANAVIELNTIEDKPIETLIQPFRGVPIDPALYETESSVKDILLGAGAQEANLGPTGNATATESSISEQSRMGEVSSNVDDLDDFLSDIARASGQILLAELSAETVQEIVGPGAVWPELNREQIAKEVYLEIKAGSSGRPNKAAELANMERGMPYLIQIPGINGLALGRKYADLLEIELDDLIVEGIPSVVAQNAMATKEAAQVQPSTGEPQTDPNTQGAQGAQNAPAAAQNEAGGQPAYPVMTFDSEGRQVA